MREAYGYAKKSRHPSTHNAALLIRNGEILLRGVNDLPPRIKETPDRIKGTNKHIYLNHAECDVIYGAARGGIVTNGLTLVMPWLPCIPCANALITAGIARLVVHRQMIERTDKKWGRELRNALKLLNEANIKVIAYDGLIGIKAYMHGQEWKA